MDPNGPERTTLDLLRMVFSLEAERTLRAAQLGRVAGAEDALEGVDTRLGQALAALELRGVAYPLHAIARRYRLSEADYLVLQLALLPRHGVEVVRAATDALGESSDKVSISHAIALVFEGFDDWKRARAELEALPVFVESLVRLGDGDDPEMTPSPAVLELLGLG